MATTDIKIPPSAGFKSHQVLFFEKKNILFKKNSDKKGIFIGSL